MQPTLRRSVEKITEQIFNNYYHHRGNNINKNKINLSKTFPLYLGGVAELVPHRIEQKAAHENENKNAKRKTLDKN